MVDGSSTTKSAEQKEKCGPAEHEDPQKEVHYAATCFFYMVLFFAVWFDARSFDQDGDGDFDPEDVEFWLAEKGILGANHKLTCEERAAAKKRAKARAKIKAEMEAKKEKERQEALAAGKHDWRDRDGDGDVDLDDLINSQVEGEAHETKAMDDLMKGRVRPWFVIFECTMCLFLWIVFAIVMSNKYGTSFMSTQGGMNSIVEGMFDLRLYGPECQDYRGQIWRWTTYQFSHVGASHVLMNVFMVIMLGIPLEGVHECWRLAIMFNVGVLGGACCYFWTDAHTPVVGCSGGCYALIGIHIADLIMNWHQKRFRIPTLVMIIKLILIDILQYTLSYDDGSKSHAAHVGGAVAGLIIGVLVCKNTHKKAYEKWIAIFLGIVGIILIAWSFGWMGAQHDGPLNIFEAADGQNGWCWFRQVYNKAWNPNAWVCVRCGTMECIDEMNLQQNIMTVSTAECAANGFYYDGR